MKFKSDGAVNVRNTNGKIKTTSVSAVDGVLQSYGIEVADQLMPLMGRLASPKKLKTYAGTEIEEQDLSKLYCLKATKDIVVEELVEALQALPEVEFAEPNYLAYINATSGGATIASPKATVTSATVNDPLYSQQWGIPAVNADKLWEQPLLTDERPVIAILDTGVEISHPDLAANIWQNPGEATGASGIDDDGNGYVDDYRGWDFVNQTNIIDDYNGHGTHCAGIAAAVGNNGIGICGANPDAWIMPVTVMQSDGTGDIATIIKGIDYATANGADVISMSFGTYSTSSALEQALGRAYATAVLVAAAGNDGHSINYGVHCSSNDLPMFPAAYSFVLGAQASNTSGLASFSNYDDDGPIYSAFGEEYLYNYEIMAPGTDIMSTYPGGKYKALNGTSMACPLVAGSISRLITAKEYITKELLFGDLIHSASDNVDFEACYGLADDSRTPKLALVSWRIEDQGDNDGRFDSGETIYFYPTFRNEWGTSQNTYYWMEIAQDEDKVVEMSRAMANFDKNLSSYAKAEAETPLIFKIKDDVVDGRKIRLTLYVQCDGMDEPSASDITITAENGTEIGGMITENTVLTEGVNYIVTRTLIIPSGVTLTIDPGCVLSFDDETGISVASGAILTANGTAEKPIIFQGRNLVSYPTVTLQSDSYKTTYYHKGDMLDGWTIINSAYGHYNGTSAHLSFVKFSYLEISKLWNFEFENCEFDEYINPRDSYAVASNFNNVNLKLDWALSLSGVILQDFYSFNNSNVYSSQNNVFFGNATPDGYAVDFKNNNIINATIKGRGTATYYRTLHPNFFGSSLESLARKNIADIENENYTDVTWKYDLSNMLTQPNPEAHGIVWKVCVNGYDAQDEFDELPPLGVGKHKVEVWYSKVIDTSEEPTIAMGVRSPYTQTSIAEDGSWRTETVSFNNNGEVSDLDVSVYTAYVTITGKMAIDGLNRIYVSGCTDLEYFDIPLENSRFNVEVAAAGSMSAGFMGEAGLGKVTLTWEEQDDNVDDILGYNLYRYVTTSTEDGEGNVTYTDSDPVKINERLLDETEYVDYDVTPGTCYNYYYKIMRTDLAENSPSSVVSVTPLSASKGDANGSLTVDVADVVTEVSYLTGGNPQPFIFEAADVNSDEKINILDVVGTINIILSPSTASVESIGTVSYWLQDGLLYIDSDVTLGGIQIGLTGSSATTHITTLEALQGFETASQWNGNDYIFLAYSMVGRTLEPGTHAILSIEGEFDLSEIVFSDARGNNVVALQGNPSSVASLEAAQMRLPSPNPFTESITIPYVIGKTGEHEVEMLFTDLQGRLVDRYATTCGYGEYSYTWAPSVARGVYLVVLYVDGQRVQTSKLIRK
ncbi:MAG: S8 family serine peptidase [Bacteroidales bacterium]|nr:S8 family serine peptidase [Bacteroidales bacterium]